MEKRQFTYINRIIANVLSREASLDEIVVFSRWLNENEKNKKEFQVLSEYWGIESGDKSFLAEISFDKNKSRIFTGKKPDLPSAKKRHLAFIFSVVASFLIVLSLGGYWFFQHHSEWESCTYLSQDGITNFILPDSSNVTLNKHSRLTYSNQFLSKNRAVSLQGEAYFEVKKMNGKKFSVQIGNSHVEVLGTKFNVNGRKPENRITVTLVEGSVLFKNENHEVLMTPNQELTYCTQTGLIENKSVDANLNTAWIEGIYHYNSIPLSELAEKLKERYGVEVAFDKHLKDIKVSGTFLQDQSIEEILNIMQNSIGFKWEKKGNKIIIY
ncbi:MAG: DUF4974 domain-containing protein [Dysgonamonadaceae bacterium]|jgi:ferric-dicitrate binding protein FerR (iron transport regulator)|nr:DUF4974 domain-containing protein [Dysgonamonadaceae bacterium]